MGHKTSHVIQCKHCRTLFTVCENDAGARKYDPYLSEGLGHTAYFLCPNCLRSVSRHFSQKELEDDKIICD